VYFGFLGFVSICRSLLSKAVGGLGCAPKLNPTQRGVLLRRLGDLHHNPQTALHCS
jgi:hypothetical protein